jgi:hypothetical protein
MSEKKAPDPKEEKTTVVAFTGTGRALLGYTLALLLCGVLALVPLPLVTVAFRKWFYRHLAVTDSGKRVSFSFDGKAVDLFRYWIPSLVLMWITGVSFYFGISEESGGFLTFLLIVISILALAPQAWLWAAKRRYILSQTKGTVGAVPVSFAFTGKGTTALVHELKMIFSTFLACLPMPWAITGAVRWSLETTDITAGTAYRPAFSGKGSSLFWYGVGFAISPFFGLLICPALIRGLIAWAARYTNIIGLERTIEFEFTGKSGPLFGYVYLPVGLAVLGIIVNLMLDAVAPEAVRFGLVLIMFIVVLPLMAAPFMRWCARHLTVYKR